MGLLAPFGAAGRAFAGFHEYTRGGLGELTAGDLRAGRGNESRDIPDNHARLSRERADHQSEPQFQGRADRGGARLPLRGRRLRHRARSPRGRPRQRHEQAPVNAHEAIALLRTVLAKSGCTVIENGRQLRIVSREKAKKADLPVHYGADPEAIEASDELITQVIPVVNMDAIKLRQDLTPMIGTDADVTANESSNAIVITDTSANIRRVVRIISAWISARRRHRTCGSFSSISHRPRRRQSCWCPSSKAKAATAARCPASSSR